jgi:ABC-type xylose transport system permease subunit
MKKALQLIFTFNHARGENFILIILQVIPIIIQYIFKRSHRNLQYV